MFEYQTSQDVTAGHDSRCVATFRTLLSVLTYLVLAGPGLDEDWIVKRHRELVLTAPDVLTHVGEVVKWQAATQRCAAWTWDSTVENIPSSDIFRDSKSLTAIAGSAWTDSSWATAASIAGDNTLISTPANLRASLTGSFSAVHLDAAGTGFVSTDATGTGHVYLARGPDFWAISNRAPLAAVGLNGYWRPDVLSQAWMPMLAIYGRNDTSVEGVELLPAAAAVRIQPGLPPVLETGLAPWEVGAQLTGSFSERLDETAHALTQFAAAVASTDVGTPVLTLSGGKDSRLVLAAFAAAGVATQVKVRTIGLPGAADREVATVLGSRLGLDLEIHEPGSDMGPSLAELDKRVRRHVFQTSGMFGAWDLQGVYGSSAEVNVSGLYGELMRTIYTFRAPVDTEAQAIDHLLHKMGWDRLKLLRSEARDRVTDGLREWAELAFQRGWTPRGLFDFFYADMRVRRWLGTAQESNLNLSANLLQLKECISLGFSASPEQRATDELHYRLIERLDRSLLEVPLAGTQWDPNLVQPGSRFGPVGMDSRVHGSEAWQIRGWPSHRRLIATELLTEDHPIHEVVDPERISKKIARPHSPRRAAQLWATWAGALWVSGGYEIFPFNGPSTPPGISTAHLISALSVPPMARAGRSTSAAPRTPTTVGLSRLKGAVANVLRRR